MDIIKSNRNETVVAESVVSSPSLSPPQYFRDVRTPTLFAMHTFACWLFRISGWTDCACAPGGHAKHAPQGSRGPYPNHPPARGAARHDEGPRSSRQHHLDDRRIQVSPDCGAGRKGLSLFSSFSLVNWLRTLVRSLIPKIGPDALRVLAKGFADEAPAVKLQILNLGAKLHLSNPEQCSALFRYVCSVAKFDANYDTRDRCRFNSSPNTPSSLTGHPPLGSCDTFFFRKIARPSLLEPMK